MVRRNFLGWCLWLILQGLRASIKEEDSILAGSMENSSVAARKKLAYTSANVG